MSLATQLAKTRFEATLKPARDLIAIHKDLSTAAGRRERELSLNRGAVVFAVAAWQAFVEQLTQGILNGFAPPPGDPCTGTYVLRKSYLEGQIRNLNTPDTRKTMALWRLIAFDPFSAWTFSFDWEKQRSVRRGGSIADSATLTVGGCKAELDGWLQVRHKIAHGDVFPAIPSVTAFVTGSRAGVPRLQRRDADRCVSFFSALVTATTAEADRVYPLP
jgi:hypothetical protein